MRHLNIITLKNLVLLATLVCSFPALVYAQDRSLKLKNVRLAPLAASQNDSDISYSTMVSWNPEYGMTSKWSVGLNLGVSALETKERNDYIVTEYQITSSYLLGSSLGLELGYGRQNWLTSNGGEADCYSGTLFYLVSKGAFKIDRTFLGYSYVANPILITREIKIGVGFSF